MALIRIKMMDKKKNFMLSENLITASSIKNAFLLPQDAIVELLYDSNGIQINCSTRITPELLFLLPDDFSTMEFFVESNRTSYRSVASMDIQKRRLTPVEVDETKMITAIMNNWESRVFNISGNELTGTCFLINNCHILTAAHLSFTLHKSYKIQGSRNQEFTANCVYICKVYNFAILQSDELPSLELNMGSLEPGSEYYMMGFPSGVDSSHPTITKGTIEGRMKDCVHLVGTPGLERDTRYSGAPVFNDSGRIAGLILGSTTEIKIDTRNRERLTSSAKQKYARILGIGPIVIEYNEGTSDSEC